MRWPWSRQREVQSVVTPSAIDFPVRLGCQVTPLVDGHAAMLAMCKAFLSAKRYILLAGWDIRADLPMVRGEDVHVGAAGSQEQQKLYADLRAAGLDAAALTFWDAGQLRVMDVLGFAARRGVSVGVLLWDAIHLGSHLTNDPQHEGKLLQSVGVDVLLDDSSRKVRHITQALHQKCAVVDGRIAFVGGIDLTWQHNGDYDRWDTHGHLVDSPERSTSRDTPSHPWHDVHTQIEGPAVADVQRNIVQRWGEVAQRHGVSTWPVQLPDTPPAPLANGIPAHIVRTIPPGTYAFAPTGINTIYEAYRSAITRAQSYIFLESQYLWQHVYEGLDTKRWGGHSAEMTTLLEDLAAALRRGVRVGLVLPDHPNVGRRFTDDSIAEVRRRAGDAADAFSVFTLGSSQSDPRAPGGVHYRPVYVHAKVAVIDDQWWTVGSANLNSRGMHSDAELNVAVDDPVTARNLRLILWSEHVHPSQEQHLALADPIEGLALLDLCAAANEERVRNRSQLVGHVLPYVTAAESRDQGLPIDPEHGWLDNLPGGAGATPAHYAYRYL